MNTSTRNMNMNMIIAVLACTTTTGVSAFSPLANPSSSSTYAATGTAAAAAFTISLDDTTDTRPVYDPFGLYPANSEERINGRLRALEPSTIMTTAIVLDPLGLYTDAAVATQQQQQQEVDMSDSLPFLPRPILLDRTLAGDVGFDPFQLAGDDVMNNNKLYMMREAELKHGRIAMLAAIGWPVSELFHPALSAHTFHLPTLLGHGDKVPSLLNGGLELVSPVFWATVVGLAGGLEAWLSNNNNNNNNVDDEYVENNNKIMNSALAAGDYGFDPFRWYPKEDDMDGRYRMQLAEIKNGRLAMMAITGFAYQELFTNTAVIHSIPFLHM